MKMVSDVIPKFNFGDEIDPTKKIEPLKDGKNDRENLYFNLINDLSSSSSHADGKNKESIDHRGELIMKKSRYSLALHPESW